MNALLYVLIGSAVLWIFLRVLLRHAVRLTFVKIGRKALDKQPTEVMLEPLSAPVWKDPSRVEAQAAPLLALGFQDLGAYTLDKMPAAKLRILLKEDDRVAAFINEHPKMGVWTELSVRYEDGTTTVLVNRAPTGLEAPPFFRRTLTDPATPTDRMYARIMKEREPKGIKAVTAATVAAEYEAAWMKIMIWQKNKGLGAEEVIAVAKRWAEKKKSGGA